MLSILAAARIVKAGGDPKHPALSHVVDLAIKHGEGANVSTDEMYEAAIRAGVVLGTDELLGDTLHYKDAMLRMSCNLIGWATYRSIYKEQRSGNPDHIADANQAVWDEKTVVYQVIEHGLVKFGAAMAIIKYIENNQ